MHEDHIGLKIKFCRIFLVDFEIILPHRIGNFLGSALNGIMNLFGDFKESCIPVDNFLSCINLKLLQYGYHPLQYLSNASSFTGRIDMEERPFAEFCSEHLQKEQVPFGRYA